MRLGRARPGTTPSASAAPLLCRWDLDKTYLRSQFDSIRQLLRTALAATFTAFDIARAFERPWHLRKRCSKPRIGEPPYWV